MTKSSDRISNLPDPLLIHILSFLRSKTSVQTSILSPRWRHIWKHVSVLDLSDDDFIQFNSEPFKHFRRVFYFVNSLTYVLKPCKVDKMRLSFTKSLTDDRHCISLVETWIQSVMGPLIKQLNLTLYTTHRYLFRLPLGISHCPNLVSLSLRLRGAFSFEVLTYVRLASLKKLVLAICPMHCPNPMHVASLNAFLHRCPGLQTLNLYLDVDDYARICVPSLCLPSSLKRFKIVVNNFNIGNQVLILDHLTISHDGKFQNVFLRASNASPFTLLKLLHILSQVKHIGFSPSATKWLLGDVTHLQIPNFGHLLHLKLNLLPFNSNSLIILLQNCHFLEDLIIQNDKEVCNDNEEQSSLPKWAAQPSVPSCLESHLSFILFKGYRGFTDELYFVEYILQKGRVLKTMIIVDTSADLKKKLDTHKILSNVPRASRMCQLLFD